METPFGELMTFDCHVHFLSHRLLCRIAEESGHQGSRTEPLREVQRILGWEMPPEDPAVLGADWVREMDRHGVDRIMLHALPQDESSLAQAILAHPNRIHGFATIDPRVPKTLQNIETFVGEMGFKGICMFPSMHHFRLDGPEAGSIFRVANALRLTVMVHCGVLRTPLREKLGMSMNFDGHFSRPQFLQRIAQEHPDIKFLIPRFGAGHFTELLMLADQCPNIYTDTTGIDAWGRYIPGNPDPALILRQAMDIFGSERILFGTDSSFFPRGWRHEIWERQMTAMREAGISTEEAQHILGGNLAKILGTPP